MTEKPGKDDGGVEKKPGKRMWLTPLLLALPWALVIGAGALRYGHTLQKLIHVAIKLVVTR